MRAEQAVEKRVARCLVFRRRRFEPAVIDGEMTGDTEFCGRCRDLALAVRLTTPPETMVSVPPDIASCRT